MAGIFDLFQGTQANNPFQAAANGDPWEGLREVGPVGRELAVGDPMASQGQASSPMRKYNPFLASDGPLASSGWIGALLSQGPTQDEIDMENLGRGQSNAVAKIGQAIQAGVPAQRAILDFAQSPEGQQFMMSGGGFQDLMNVAKGMSPTPLPDPIKMGAGEKLFQPDGQGGGTEVYANPPTEVQKFQSFSELGNLSDEEIETLARAQLNKDILGGGDPTEGEAAMQRLIDAGKISRETADLNLAGLIKIQPVLDPSGATVGHVLIDTSTGQITQLDPKQGGENGELPKPGQKNYAPGITPGSEEDKTQDNKAASEDGKVSADIVDGAGPTGWIGERLGGVLGNAAPEWAAKDITAKRKALGAIKADGNMLAKEGRVLAQEMKDLGTLTDTLNFATNPIDAAQTLVSLHERYTRMEIALTEIADDPDTTGKVRGDALIDLANVKRAKANMPSIEDLKVKITQLERMKPFEQIGNTIKDTKDAAAKGGIIEGDEQPDPNAQVPSFTDPAAVRKAVANGTLKPGDKIIFNGVEKYITDTRKSKDK